MNGDPFQTPYGQSILAGLQSRHRNIYPGTVPEDVKAKRRAKNRVARKTRRAQRSK